MNVSRLFIMRPVATSLCMLALFLAGVLGYRALPVSALPEIDYPTIQVQTFYPGASADVMVRKVTAPLERQFGSMPGLNQMISQSSAGASLITLQFSLVKDLDSAEQEVQAAINAAGSLLPNDLPNPPVYSKVNPADPPIMTLSVTSDALPMTQIEDLADTRLAQKISQLLGVGLVTLSGGERPAVRIAVNPKVLAAHGFTLADIRTAIGRANVSGSKGSFDGKERASSIDANDQLTSADAYGDIILGYKNGAPLRLKDVAEVNEGAENIRLAAYVAQNPQDKGGQPFGQAIILSIQRQPGSNVIAVADRVKKVLPSLLETLPGSVSVRILTDKTEAIRATVRDVEEELLLAVLMVIMVIWLFLRDARATCIPAVAVPLSLLGSLAVMYFAGYSLNNLTLMALVIATGFVVDDAIVVIENIVRFREAGKSPLDAALIGAGQIGFTILSLTISLVAVLIPLLCMGGIAGRLFREFAVTLASTILLSAVISLTLTPMLCATILRTPRAAKGSSFFARLLALYERLLDVVFAHQGATLLVALLTLLLTAFLYVVIPKGFFPVQDTGIIQGIAELPQDSSFTNMTKRQRDIAACLLEDPAVESLAFFVGVDGINQSPGTSRVTVKLKPLDERGDRAQAIADRLMRRSSRLPGLTLYLSPVQDLTIEDRLSRFQYQFSVDALNQDSLEEWVPRLTEALSAQPEIGHVAHDLQSAGRQLWLAVNRDVAGKLGVSMSDIDNALYDAFGQRQISTIFTQTNQYKVVLEVGKQFRRGPKDLESIYVKAADGRTVPLSVLVKPEERAVRLSYARQGQFAMATVSFVPAEGFSLGDAIARIGTVAREIALPESLTLELQGAAAAFASSSNDQLLLILAALVTVYIVLGVLYESYIHPVTIISTLPSAGVGALLALLLASMDLGIAGVIGIILLIGIVKKNAIMMIDFALDAERKEGKSSFEAIRQACLLRLRPILMTTMAALLGALPLVLFNGMGSEIRAPLGVTMIGGLLVSQLLTLFTTPVIYLWFGRLQNWFARSFGRGG